MNDEIDWPPPWCDACRDRRHDECVGPDAWCECIDCPDLYDERPNPEVQRWA